MDDGPLSIGITNPTTTPSTDDGSNGKWLVLDLVIVTLRLVLLNRVSTLLSLHTRDRRLDVHRVAHL